MRGDRRFRGTNPHSDERDLRRLMLGKLPQQEALGVVRHLLSGCRDCTGKARRYWRLGEWPPGIKADLLAMAALVRLRRSHDEPGLT